MQYSPRKIFPAATALTLLILSTLPALASLGGDVSSVDTDRVHMKALVQISQTNGYDLHQMRTPAGTTISEYVSPGSGKVFAVTWQGPFPPDMQQLLGSYFQQYSAALQAQEHRYGRHPLNIQLPGLVIQTAGHMRAYYGRIFVPAMVPEGVKAERLK